MAVPPSIRTGAKFSVPGFCVGAVNSVVDEAVSSAGGAGRIVLEADAGGSPPTRRELDRFLAVGRTVGLRGELALTRENVRVEFRYDLG